MTLRQSQPRATRRDGMEGDPLWYKDAVIYELHVRAFFDTDGDGIGDFQGLRQKLDYLQDLGVTALWLLPFYPSPLKDDGYDIADYTSVHPSYGTLQDFQAFLREAHRRGIRVITELVLNHTSDQHPWFQRARNSPPGSRWRDFYVWSDTPERYRDARIIFKDFESSNWSWDPVAHGYYWHRFYSHQPDLNFERPYVQRAMQRVLDFWMEMGVDGLRLDAVPYLFEREGTSSENLPETHEYLKELRRYVDSKYSGRMLLAEANQWPEDAIAYLGDGDECHMAFHFPVMPRLFMAIRMEDRFPIIDILQQTPPIPDTTQWALFLRNHDELTLEMVTDEDRDYMYRVYATDPQARINLGIRRRLAPLLGNHRRRIELMNGLLFSLPGTPVLYYGDELGMGDNIYLGDRNGVRTPMQWSADRNAGFSRANPQRLYLPTIIDSEYHYEAVNVEAQQNNPHSLLWWMKRLIALRKQYQVFGRGSLEFLHPDNRKVLTFLRRYGDECVLVVANLSRFVQWVELDLSAFRGVTPVELFGRVPFPPVGEQPYFLTLGPHAFYWFSLEPQRSLQLSTPAAPAAPSIPLVTLNGSWDGALKEVGRSGLEAALLEYIKGRRWFSGKARSPQNAEIIDQVVLAERPRRLTVALVQVRYADGDPDTYVLPLAFTNGEDGQAAGDTTICRLRLRPNRGAPEQEGLLYEALLDHDFTHELPLAIARGRRYKGKVGDLVATAGVNGRRQLRSFDGQLDASLLRGEQSNTSLVYGDQYILKLIRRLEPGVNPDLEMGRYLTERCAYPHSPQVLGAVEYQRHRRSAPSTIGILQQYVANEGDAWHYTLDSLGNFFERVLALPEGAPPEPPRWTASTLLAGINAPLPEQAYELTSSYLQSVELLGQRTAELHCALAVDRGDAGFTPEQFTPFYQQSVFQSLRRGASQTLQLLRKSLPNLSQPSRVLGEVLLEREGELLRHYQALTERRIAAVRIRCHGDYHLGQVLFTGKDFVILDFEGEPARPLSERRIKRAALRDVAGMLRSFDYAAEAALTGQVAQVAVRSEDLPRLAPWAACWANWVSTTFLREYLAHASSGDFLPKEPDDVRLLLDVLLLEKAVYELGYELNHRPDWAHIPLQGILELLSDAGDE